MIYVSIKRIDQESLAPLFDEFCKGVPFPADQLVGKRVDLYTRRICALALARSLLFKAGLCKHEHAIEAQIKHKDSGKPYLSIPKCTTTPPEISISHSGPWLACAIGEQSTPLGIDIEDMTIPRSYKEITSHSFFKDEQEIVEKDGSLAFYKLWGAKEAVAKCLGQGLSKALSIDTALLIHKGEDIVDGSPFQLFQQEMEGHLFLTIAQHKENAQDITFL